MLAVTAPASVRDQALAVIRPHVPGSFDLKMPVVEAGGEILSLVLYDLEQTFGILIEVDEAWTGVTVEELALLVETKVSDLCRKALLPANDDMAFIDRSRARRARGEPQEPYLPPAHMLPPNPTASRIRHTRLFLTFATIAAMAGGAGGMIVGVAALASRAGWL